MILPGNSYRERSQYVTIDRVEHLLGHVLYHVTVESIGEPPEFMYRQLPAVRQGIRFDIDEAAMGPVVLARERKGKK